ncbi:MAG TPA: right-handed parallel beta-helix repeat-containing protein [bacterium]|nr:right-handed parallel beta-helix repeat-containing protein [bacterium]
MKTILCYVRWGGILCISSLLLYCDTKPPLSSQGLDQNTITTSEDIVTDEVWKANQRRVVTRQITISNAILKIESGVRIHFQRNAGIVVGDSAGLIAVGKDQAIVFSSDTTNKGEWTHIHFEPGSLADSCRLINCVFEYGGGDANQPAIIVCDNSSPLIQGCIIRKSGTNGVLLRGDCRGIEFFNNSISQCSGAPVVTYATNVHFIGRNSYADNTENQIKIMNNAISHNDSWQEQPIPYFLTSGLEVRQAGLTILPGAQLNFAESTALTVSDNGSVKADATAAPITFSGSSGKDWLGIQFYSSANHTDSKMIRCTIENRGQGDIAANITLKNSAPLIQDCTIRGSAGYGIYAEGDVSVANVINNQFSQNNSGAISIPARQISHLKLQRFGGDETNFIEVRGGNLDGYIETSTRLVNYRVPYKIISHIKISAATLTIDPGSLIQMTPKSGFEILAGGGFYADGSSSIITITGEIARHGYWDYILFSANANPVHCVLKYCQIRYGGGDGNLPGMIYCDNVSPIITNCFIEYSQSYGIFLKGSARINDINTNSFYQNLFGDYISAP